jgi:transcription termination factor Rho
MVEKLSPPEDMNPEESMNLMLKNMKGTRNNDEFLASMNG